MLSCVHDNGSSMKVTLFNLLSDAEIFLNWEPFLLPFVSFVCAVFCIKITRKNQVARSLMKRPFGEQNFIAIILISQIFRLITTKNGH